MYPTRKLCASCRLMNNRVLPVVIAVSDQTLNSFYKYTSCVYAGVTCSTAFAEGWSPHIVAALEAFERGYGEVIRCLDKANSYYM